MKVGEYFSMKEFDCADGTPYPAVWVHRLSELCSNLDVIREWFNKPIRITSGYRTPAHNRRVGGVKDSYHTQGMAADFVVVDEDPREVAAIMRRLIAIRAIDEGGIGDYSTFTHYDLRNKPARWRGR